MNEVQQNQPKETYRTWKNISKACFWQVYLRNCCQNASQKLGKKLKTSQRSQSTNVTKRG